jgi:hypothetical protein
LSSTSPYQNLMMFKILILQAWYNLSDEALEKQIARDLMFSTLLIYPCLRMIILFA